MAQGDLSFHVRESYACADECANVATITNKLPSGVTVNTDLVAVYRVNSAGLIVSMKAYWDVAKVMEQVSAMVAR